MEWVTIFQRGTAALALLCLAVFLVLTTGCAPVQIKATAEQPETAEVSEDEKEVEQSITREHLQDKLMGFADTFITKYSTAISISLEHESPTMLMHAARSKYLTAVSAFEIASNRNPKINLVDMMVLVALTRMSWEDYWQPVVYGDSAQEVVETLRELEEDIWTIAARILTPEQQKRMHALIRKWREENRDIQYVSFIRLDTILEFLGKDSEFQEATQPGGLLAPITEATQAVDEVRFTAERAMYLLSRLQMTVGIQAQITLHDIAARHDVKQLLSDITGFREAMERLPAEITEEGKRLVKELESQEGLVRGVLTDIRQTMREGNDLLARVDETAKTVDSTATQIDSILRTPASGRPFDIMDYYNTVLAAADALTQANSLIGSMDRLLASPEWEQHKQTPLLVRVVEQVQSETKEVITHAFGHGVALILIFFIAMFLTLVGYRYVSKRIKG
jgi:hypothetical protein